MSSFLRKISVSFLILLLILATLSLLVFFAKRPIADEDQLSRLESVESMGEVSPEKKKTFRLLSFNLAFLYGEGSEGEAYSPRGKEFFQRKLMQLQDLVSGLRIDFILLQEVDFESVRSHDFDAVKWLLKKTEMNHAARIASWNHHYVPFPYWPFSRHFGRMLSGGAIVSRYPIQKKRQHKFEHPEEFPFWYRWFYLRRYVQTVLVKAGQQQFELSNLHLESYSKPAREKQIRFIANHFGQTQGPAIIGGDFNAGPCSEETEQLRLGNLEFAGKCPHSAASFPVKNPTQTLDSLWLVGEEITVLSYDVLCDVDLSDHCPVMLQFKVDGE